MSLILGIDTGGTFTDAVIFDTEADLVLCKSKRFTTHKDLCLGISNALAALPDRFYSQIEYVHLSTTLATNYILEQDMPDNGDELGDDPAANTGLLNTWIKPIISDWLKSIKKVLLQYDIRGRLYILNSAGTLMDEQEAIQSPTSTLLSGPVASVMGGFYLSDQSDFLVVDMGGTTADITKIENGTLRFSHKTVTIGNHPIILNALDIQSFPVGGDTHIHYNQIGKLELGPRKVIPLCVASSQYPNLYAELRDHKKTPGYEMFSAYETDCFIVGKWKTTLGLSDFERKVMRFLSGEPHSLFCIADHFNIDPDALHLSKLVDTGYLYRISFTPTDVLHALGRYDDYDEAIAKLGAKIMADLGDYTVNEFLDMCETLVSNNLVFSCMQSIANFEKQQFDFRDSPGTLFLINKYLDCNQHLCSFEFNICKPIVALGAPSVNWMQQVAAKLGTDFELPEYYDVANAIGAAVAPDIRKTEDR